MREVVRRCLGPRKGSSRVVGHWWAVVLGWGWSGSPYCPYLTYRARARAPVVTRGAGGRGCTQLPSAMSAVSQGGQVCAICASAPRPPPVPSPRRRPCAPAGASLSAREGARQSGDFSDLHQKMNKTSGARGGRSTRRRPTALRAAPAFARRSPSTSLFPPPRRGRLPRWSGGSRP